MKLAVCSVALALAAAMPSLAVADEARPVPHITVTGEGRGTLKPDLAILSLGVMRQAETASAALAANNKAMAEVIAAMKAEGIAERDLQTESFSIYPRYSQPKPDDPDQQQKIVAYQATNTLTVRVRAIDRVGAILDKAVDLGVNQGGGIAFTNDDPGEAMTAARRNAVADAMRNARTLTEAAGEKLGRVLEISEPSYTPPPGPALAKSFAAAADAVPVQPGETSYSASISMTFALEP